jgi:hypothetical protein
MSSVTGHVVPLSLPRRLVDDFVHAGRQLPAVPIQRRMELGELLAARAAATPKPSWCSVFTKAFAAISARRPELRRIYLRRPWARLFQYDETLISVVVEREWRGEPGLFLACLRSPEKLPLTDLDGCLRRFKERPVEEVSAFRGALRVARLPGPIRRLLWRLMLNWMPRTRGRLLGTLGVSVTAGLGAACLSVIAPWTVSLFYDRFDDDGALDVRMAFDHRVVDGALMAAVLVDMERELRGPILEELRALRPAVAA